MMAKIQYLNDRIAETRQEIADLEEQTEEKKDLFSDRLVCLYKAGTTSYLEILLNSDSLSDFMARLYYLKEIAQDDARIIEEYKVMTVSYTHLDVYKRQELRQKRPGKPAFDVCFIACGVTVQLALEAARALETEGLSLIHI